MLIPMVEANQTTFTLPDPESYWYSDLFIFEIPDNYLEQHTQFSLYLLLDMGQENKATVMLESADFSRLHEFSKTHRELRSHVEVQYTF